jgi:uncharacterized protein
MEPIVYRLDSRLANPGDLTTFAGHIDLPSYELGGREFVLPEGLDYDLVLTNGGEGILASGMLRGHVEGSCDRCLEPASFEIAGEVNEYYLFEAPQDARSYDSDGDFDEDYAEEDDDFYLVEDDCVDLTDALIGALLMDTPFVVLCREDCKGLCPHCGQNLNEGECDCASHEAERKAEMSPFAALKGLDLPE